MDDFEKELKQAFLDEATQLLTDAEKCFLILESNPEDASITDQLFRLAHNLKGSGKAVGFSELGDFTHKLESLLLKIKHKEIQIQKRTVDLLLKCNDHLQQWIALLKNDFDAKVDSAALTTEIESQLSSETGKASRPSPTVAETPIVPSELPAPTYPPADAFVEDPAIIAAPADEKVPQAIAEITAKNIPTPAAATVRTPSNSHGGDESIRVSLARLDKLLNFVGEMVILQSVLKEQNFLEGQSLVRKTVHQLGKVTKEVQDISMSLRMVPLKQTFQKMQRIVRDTSASLSKKVTLIIEGDETEVDKTVLESLGDPLVHLIRNAVDHGIESTDLRIAGGKSEEGLVLLKAYHQGDSLIIEVKDDGAGLNPEKLRNKAVEKGILRPDAKLTDAECYQLIFAPGFSTKQVVTDVSGRGVGMDVVRTNIEALQGDIQIETQAGSGTCFKVSLPLTLAIIDGMIVRSSKERYVVPLAHVHETVKPAEIDVHFTTGVGEIYCLRGESLPLYRLSQLLGSKSNERPAWESTAIVVRPQGQAFAVLLDEVVGQAQVVIKQLGQEHSKLKGFTGSAILGDGRPALILELPELSLKAKPLAAPLQSTLTSNTSMRNTA